MNKIKIYIIISLFFTSISAMSKDLNHEQIIESYYKSYNYEKTGNYTDAIKSIQLVYEKHSNNYTINNRLGYLYRLLGQYRNSIVHYNIALKAKPSSLTTKLGIQYSHILSENYSKTLELGYQIIRIDYYNYYGNYRMAYALLKLKEYDLAEKTIKKMLTIYPDDVLFLTELGLIKKETGYIGLSKEIMSQVIILDPENVRAKSALLEINE